MHKLPQPVKLRYWGPFFRHEAPQAGRFRQFTQVGAEALGSDDPSLDAELILLLAELLEGAEVKDVRLRLSSLGDAPTRESYGAELRAYLREREGELSEEVRARIDANPLRAFDSDHAGTREVMEGAPQLLDRLAPEDAEHFAEVRALLDEAERGLRARPDAGARPGLLHAHGVRVRERRRWAPRAAWAAAGATTAWWSSWAARRRPASGWAAGIERILLAGGREARALAEGLRVVPSRGRRARPSRWPVRSAAQGLHAELEQAGRSLKGQLKHADRIGAAYVVIVGDGIEVKDMGTGEQRPVAERRRGRRGGDA